MENHKGNDSIVVKEEYSKATENENDLFMEQNVSSNYVDIADIIKNEPLENYVKRVEENNGTDINNHEAAEKQSDGNSNVNTDIVKKEPLENCIKEVEENIGIDKNISEAAEEQVAEKHVTNVEVPYVDIVSTVKNEPLEDYVERVEDNVGTVTNISKTAEERGGLLHSEETDRQMFIKSEEVYIKPELDLERNPTELSHVPGDVTDGKSGSAYKCNLCNYENKHKAGLESHILAHANRSETKNSIRKDLADIIEQNGDIVDFLLTNNFGSFSHDEKCLIMRLDRPLPHLTGLINTTRKGKRTFSTSWYDQYQWLTGSPIRNKLFCWPCTLFLPYNDSNTWGKLDDDNLMDLFPDLHKHSITQEHTFSELKCNLFDKQNMPDAMSCTRQEYIKKLNRKVSHNREILQRLIDVILFLVFSELYRRRDSVREENFKELLKLCGQYDSKLNDFLSESSAIALTKEIQDDLIDSISHIVRCHIEMEIMKSDCFSLEIDETTGINCASRISVIFRYCVNGVPVERFVEFLKVNPSHRADDLYVLLGKKYDKFNLREKLVAQTYDGTCVITEGLDRLQAKMKAEAPQALFIYHHAYTLNAILQDACATIKECRIFFEIIGRLLNFFSNSTKRSEALSQINILQVEDKLHWNIITNIVNHREGLISVFEYFLESVEYFTDDDTIREAAALKYHLNSFNFVLLLNIFNLIFSQTEVVRNENFNQLYDKNQIDRLLITLKSYTQNSTLFENILEETQQILGIPLKKRKTESDELADVAKFRKIFPEILNIVIIQIETRFSDLEKMQYFELLDSEKFIDYKLNFPDEQFDNLLVVYPEMFNRVKLRNELAVIYNDNFFEKKTLTEMSTFLQSNSLNSTMSEVSTLLSIMLSLPVTAPSVKRDSTIKRTKRFLRNCSDESRLSNLALISIEQLLIGEMQANPNFYDKVIDHFASTKNRCIDLIYKDV